MLAAVVAFAIVHGEGVTAEAEHNPGFAGAASPWVVAEEAVDAGLEETSSFGSEELTVVTGCALHDVPR